MDPDQADEIWMRILHIENTAGVGWQIAQGQRMLGHEVTVLETYRCKIQFQHDVTNFYEGPLIPLKMLRTLMLSRHFDVVHLHAGIAFKRIDLTAIKRIMRKPLVVHFHGSETRMGYGLHRPQLIDAKIVATPDLLQYHPGATYVPIPQEPLPYHYEFNGRVKVIHAPTNRKLKGTDLILKAIEQARSEGLDFDFELIDLIPHDQMLERFKHNNIYIDRVIAEVDGKPIGTMGVAPLEAMSIGNTVLMHLNDQYLQYYEGCPVFNVQTTVESVVAALRRLILDPAEIERLGRIGSDYVRETRDPKRIGQQCVDVYETVLRR